MNSKNIIVFHPISKWIGGGETGLLDLLRNIDKNKFKIQVVIPYKGPLSEELTKINIPIKFLHIRRWHSLETKVLLPYLMIKLSFIIKSFNPDLIFCNSHDVVPFGVLSKIIFKKPVVSFIGVELHRNLAKKYLVSYSDAIIVKTEWQKKELEAIKCKNVHNLGDGFEIDKFVIGDKEIAKEELRKELKLQPDSFILLSVGRFEDVKNFEYTIKALSELNLNNVYLIIIGAKFDNSLYEKKIVNLIKELNLEQQVKILPFTRNLQKYFLGSDVFIQSSKSEGLPRSVIEAMLYGLPIILSDIEPHIEIIQKAKGFLTNLYNTSALSEKILYFYNNRKIVEEFGNYNRKISVQNYDIKFYVKKIEEIFTNS
ncbi:MAG: glycosyltransferase family 4 protein [Elusimicrobiales bacterium]|nr:glycosyltransferase family 4 protein [Elusimicrobiales bacterium]